MNIKKFLNIKNFHLIFVPENSGTEAKSTKISSNKLILYISVYSLVIALLGFLLLRISPLDDLIFSSGQSLSAEEIKKIQNLNEKLYFLTKELESLKSTNERLKYAIILGDSSLIDTVELKKTLIQKEKIKPKEGNIFGTLLSFIKNFFSDKNDDIYFIMPLNGFISREFLPEKGHMGIDIVAKSGSPIYSAETGYVIFSDYTSKDGYMVIINHSNDYISIYKHCSSLLKKERETVLQGELIALSGNSGEITSGPHLHFEIWKDGKPINPKNVLIKY